MSPLWKIQNVKQLQLINRKPSPKQYSYNRSFARNSGIYRKRYSLQNGNYHIKHSAIKGISLFISRSPQLEASMTVEAAIVLPLFLFFFLNLSCAIELIRLHDNLEFALRDVGNRMSVYGYVLEEQGVEAAKSDEGLWEELKDVAFSYTFVKKEMVRYVGESYLQESPVVEGANGLQFWESEIFGEDDCIEIIATYRVSPFVGTVGFGSFCMANRYYGHVWSGYRIPGVDSEQESEIVYVAENGVVYHESKNCSYLFLSVRGVSLAEARESHNTGGERYTPCMRCFKEENLTETVYITEDGENIHCRKDCGSLRRTVYTLAREDAKKYRACGRCAQE